MRANHDVLETSLPTEVWMELSDGLAMKLISDKPAYRSVFQSWGPNVQIFPSEDFSSITADHTWIKYSNGCGGFGNSCSCDQVCEIKRWRLLLRIDDLILATASNMDFTISVLTALSYDRQQIVQYVGDVATIMLKLLNIVGYMRACWV